MRLLVVSARYPSGDRPAAGSFVRDRLAGVNATVVAPARYDQPGWQRYVALTWQALTARGRFDGVECHFVMPSGPVGLLAARLRRIPLVVVAHRSPLHRWLARRVLGSADAVVANSPDTAAAVAALGARAEVVPPGVDLERFGPTPRPATRRVLYLGGAAPDKGPEVARKLADTLAGPGIREASPAEVPVLLAEHDVLLMPSRAEGFGLAAAEAIASGRWVVASAVGGLADVVTDGVNGTLGRDGDFAAALMRVPDYDPRVVASTAARFDAARQRAQMADIWRAVIAARHARGGG